MRRAQPWEPHQRRELWERWRAGEPLVEIARALSRPAMSVYGLLRRHGGIAPSVRRRADRALSLEEREEISRALAAGQSLRSVARALHRAPSTISREVRRHRGLSGYRAYEADQRAWDRGLRPKVCKLKQHRRLRRAVAGRLQLDWSPQQISVWLERQY